MIKRIVTCVSLLIVITVLLNGCSFKLRSIESLMRPPYTSTEKELEKSIQKLLGTHISYRSPQSGEYHSAITLRDINGDKIQEAVVFYVNNDDDSIVRMCVLSKSDDEWNLLSDFAGNGSSVLTLDFADLNSDMCEEIIVSWNLFADRSQKMISVYSSKSVNDSLQVSACISEPYDLVAVSNVYGDEKKQIIIAHSSLNQSTTRTTVKLLSVNSECQAELINETKLDSRITKLLSIVSDVPSGLKTPRFFIDAQISDSQCITHVLQWNTENQKFVSVIDDVSNPDITLRSNNLLCKDVDGDSLVEIPLRKPMSESKDGDTTFGYLLEWCSVQNNKLVPVEYFVVNLLENYSLYFPENWKNKLFINSDPETRSWHFVDKNNNKLFTITAFDFSDWDENSVHVTEMLMMHGQTVYACTITQDGINYGIKAVDLLKYFSLNV